LTNTTGILPTEYKVLIAPKPAEERKGSIIMPDQVQEAEKFAAIEGTIVGMSHLAFTYVGEDEWAGKKPQPGQRVVFAKYAGVRMKSPKDGQEYLLINDKDVVATIED
jgi:co-chaperonin GroES (HSP10)